MNEEGEKSTNSFFMGDSGIYLFYCIYACEINKKDIFDENFNKLIKLKKISESKYSEVELLYGTTGYLYSLLFLKKYLLSQDNKNKIIDVNQTKILDNTIKDIFNILINSGINYMKKYKWDKSLLFPFDISGNRPPSFY